MPIEWWRDLIICIFGIGATITVVAIGLIVILFYRRIKRVMDSVESTANKVQDIVSCVQDELVKPLGQLAGFVQGLRQAFNIMGRFSRKKEE